jgi:hypothetical protein
MINLNWQIDGNVITIPVCIEQSFVAKLFPGWGLDSALILHTPGRKVGNQPAYDFFAFGL